MPWVTLALIMHFHLFYLVNHDENSDLLWKMSPNVCLGHGAPLWQPMTPSGEEMHLPVLGVLVLEKLRGSKFLAEVSWSLSPLVKSFYFILVYDSLTSICLLSHHHLLTFSWWPTLLIYVTYPDPCHLLLQMMSVTFFSSAPIWKFL